MNKSTNSAASALLALSLTGLLLAVGQAQAGGQRPRTAPTSVSEQAGALGGRVGLRQPMSAEEKLIRNAYVKLMRYQSASLDEAAATSKKEIQPDDYLRFELRDIHSGPIGEISSRLLSELVTPPGGDIVTVKPNHRVWGNGPAHAYYEAEWAGASDAQQTGESATVEEMLRSGGEKLLGVEKYTSYQVSVRLGGKQRIYRSMALHHGKSETGKKGSEIIDNITSEMNTVLSEESPRVRSPWKTYVKTGLYLAIAREIRDKEKAGLPLIREDAPIGYLPGDDAVPDADKQVSIAVVCVGKSVTVSGTLGPNDGDSVNWTVTVAGGTATTYVWSAAPYESSGTGNNPNVTFSSTTTATTTTNAHWYAYPNQECGAQAGSTYKIKCKVHFSDGEKKTGEALMVVNGWWAPGGYVDRSIARLGGFPTLAAGANGIWRVTGMGNLARIIPTTKQIFVPLASQFYQKTDRHEQVHLDNWNAGALYGDVFQPAAFYDRVKNFTASSQPELWNKVTDEYHIYFDFEVDFVGRNTNQDEKLAYIVSDQIAPRYLYQNCGRYP